MPMRRGDSRDLRLLVGNKMKTTLTHGTPLKRIMVDIRYEGSCTFFVDDIDDLEEAKRIALERFRSGDQGDEGGDQDILHVDVTEV
jgi:hypothetical protein